MSFVGHNDIYVAVYGYEIIGRFYTKGRIIRLDELGQTFCSSSGYAVAENYNFIKRFSDFACLVAVCPCCSIVVHLETT